MRVFIIASLLFAASMAQTGDAAAGAGGLNQMMDLGDMYPELGDLYDNAMGYMMGGMGGGAAPAAGGAGGAAGGLGGGLGNLPMFGGYGDINDLMSDVVDNMKDGDIYDVMENLMPMAQMGLPGLDMNSIMSGGMPDLSGIMQGLSPYLAMDGDFYGDFGDIYGYASDMYEDYMKYGGMMGGMGGNQMLRKNRVKRHRAHKPSRLLKRTGSSKKHLRHKREFPFFAMQAAQGGSGSGSSSGGFPFFGFDSPDSEDLAAFLMMGGNRQAVPPPLDGIDTEDMWMYRGTKWDPMAMFKSATASTGTNADGSNQSGMNPWLYALFSGLQKRHMQQKKS